MAKKSNRKNSDEFKRQAVQLSYELGPTRAANQLGISEVNMSNWRAKQTKVGAIDEKSKIESQEQELKRLRKENEEQKNVIYILNRAAAFFSQDQLKKNFSW
jgi:transposase